MDIINQVLAICGGVSIVGGAIAAIMGWIKPAFKFKGRVEDLEVKVEKDYRAILEIKDTQSMLCQGMLALINSQISGNDIENLKKTRDSMLEHLSKQ